MRLITMRLPLEWLVKQILSTVLSHLRRRCVCSFLLIKLHPTQATTFLTLHHFLPPSPQKIVIWAGLRGNSRCLNIDAGWFILLLIHLTVIVLLAHSLLLGRRWFLLRLLLWVLTLIFCGGFAFINALSVLWLLKAAAAYVWFDVVDFRVRASAQTVIWPKAHLC